MFITTEIRSAIEAAAKEKDVPGTFRVLNSSSKTWLEEKRIRLNNINIFETVWQYRECLSEVVACVTSTMSFEHTYSIGDKFFIKAQETFDSKKKVIYEPWSGGEEDFRTRNEPPLLKAVAKLEENDQCKILDLLAAEVRFGKKKEPFVPFGYYVFCCYANYFESKGRSIVNVQAVQSISEARDGFVKELQKCGEEEYGSYQILVPNAKEWESFELEKGRYTHFKGELERLLSTPIIV